MRGLDGITDTMDMSLSKLLEMVGGAIYGAECFGHAGAYDWFLQTLGSLKGVKQRCDVVKCVLLKKSQD